MKKALFRSNSNDQCVNCKNHHKSLFCDTANPVLSQIDQSKYLMTLTPGEALFQTGESIEGIYCVREGTIKLERTGKEGQTHILHIVNPGGVLGMAAVISGEKSDLTAVCLQPTEVCFIPKQAFLKVLQDDPSATREALKRATQGLREVEQRLCHATDLTAVERVAEALLHLKDQNGSQNWSRRELAEWAGTTTETAIRTLSQFAKEGLIEMEGKKIHIKNANGLLEKAKIYI